MKKLSTLYDYEGSYLELLKEYLSKKGYVIQIDFRDFNLNGDYGWSSKITNLNNTKVFVSNLRLFDKNECLRTAVIFTIKKIIYEESK